MPFVRAKTLCFIANTLRKEGEVFEYNGPFNHHVEPVGEAGVEQEPAAEPAPAEAKAPKLKLRRGSASRVD